MSKGAKDKSRKLPRSEWTAALKRAHKTLPKDAMPTLAAATKAGVDRARLVRLLQRGVVKGYRIPNTPMTYPTWVSLDAVRALRRPCPTCGHRVVGV